jgi:hypothetical protein
MRKHQACCHPPFSFQIGKKKEGDDNKLGTIAFYFYLVIVTLLQIKTKKKKKKTEANCCRFLLFK